jgi:hypothetical protein
MNCGTLIRKSGYWQKKTHHARVIKNTFSELLKESNKTMYPKGDSR